MTHRAGLVLALVRLLLPAAGEAAPAPRPAQASLSVSKKASAHSCPAEKELRANVTAILGYAPFHKGARRHVTAVLWAADGTFHARIKLLDARTHKTLGNRELSAAGPTCEALSEAMALAIALAIDPLAQPPQKPAAALPPVAVASGPTPAARPKAAPALAASSSTAVASSREPAQPAPAPLPSEPPLLPLEAMDAGAPEAAAALTPADAGGEADAGTALAVPGLPAAVDAGAALAVPGLPAAVDAGAPAAVAPVVVPPVETPAPVATASQETPPSGGFHGLVGAGADVTVGLVPSTAFAAVLHGGVAWNFASAELEARWLPSTSTAFGVGTISSTLRTGALVGCATFQSVGAFGACGLLEVGPLTSQGRGYSESFKTTTWTVALGVRGQWDWVFAHPVGLRVHVDGLVNVVRTRVLVGPDVAWQAPTLALDVGAGLFLVF
jgi:hypothetical protein